MPIKREHRKFYGAKWRAVVRPRILRRAGGRFTRGGRYKGGARCEHCNALDRSKVVYHPDFPGHYFVLNPQPALFATGEPVATCHKRDGGEATRHRLPGDLLDYLTSQRQAAKLGVPHMVKVQIGVAHRNHTPGDDRPSNLLALCRRCHLAHDEPHHKATRSARKDAARPLLNAEAVA